MAKMTETTGESGLLEDIGGEERQKEQFEPMELKFDAIKKIASLFEKQHDHPTEFEHLKGPAINKLQAYYLMENLNTFGVNVFLAEQAKMAIPKLMLIDLCAGLTGMRHYDPKDALDVLADKIASDVYHDVYAVLREAMRNNPKLAGFVPRENVKIEDLEKRFAKDIHKDLVRDLRVSGLETKVKDDENMFYHFKGCNIDTTMAAANFSKYVDGFDERLQHISTIRELKQLFGARLYCNMISEPEFKKQVEACINDTRYSMNDVFIYSILKYHQDFFKKMETK